jgi:two-component system phosphate regulon response regulator PhoB
MSASVMIVEDEPTLTLILRYNLEREGYAVETADRGDDAEARLKESTPDLLLLDWTLPGLSGLELCRRLRRSSWTRQLPIIMLTARSEERDRVQGLSAGADDYVVKPFSFPELLARIRALLRRTHPKSIDKVLATSDLELDRERHRIRRGGREVIIAPMEFRLLEFLMQRPGRVFSREQLLDGIWGQGVYLDVRTIDVNVGRLRKALNKFGDQDAIRTVRGVGYSLNDQENNNT